MNFFYGLLVLFILWRVVRYIQKSTEKNRIALKTKEDNANREEHEKKRINDNLYRVSKQKEEFLEYSKIELNKYTTTPDGVIKVVDNDFSKLIRKNQDEIFTIDKSYVHRFVKNGFLFRQDKN